MSLDRPPHRICLVGGTGRSGTTLLRRIFATHPAVASLPTEMRLLTDPDGIVDFVSSVSAGWSPYVFDTHVRRLARLLRDLGSGGLVPKSAPAPRSTGAAARARPAARRTRFGRLAPLIVGSPVMRLLPRYWTVDLAAACPSYEQLVDQLVEQLVEFRYRGRWAGMASQAKSEISYGGPDVSTPLRDFCRAFVGCVCEAQRATHFIDDTPFNLLGFGVINALLPESRLVHIYRDPRDVVASYMQRLWAPSDALQAARFYAGVMARWEALRERLPTGSYIEVSLESLVREPEPPLRAMCALWDLDWRRPLLEADLSQSNSGRWRRDIPPADRADVENILGPYLDRYADSSTSRRGSSGT